MNNLRSRLERLERENNTPVNLDEMTDEQLAQLAGFSPGYVPTDEELQAIANPQDTRFHHES
jgi:hypothetical protein